MDRRQVLMVNGWWLVVHSRLGGTKWNPTKTRIVTSSLRWATPNRQNGGN
ncbi:MAG: hypothetical protein ACHBN1_32310 [Heteroscytonema crispum UTEX LB 1556]